MNFEAPFDVALVDDAEEVQDAVREALCKTAQLTVFQNGSSARRHFLQHSFDFVILDVLLPDDNGVALCQFLRSLPSYQQTPILMLSAVEQVDVKLKGFALGCDDYVIKPFHVDELKARMQAIMKRSANSNRICKRVGNIEFDYALQRITVLDGSENLDLNVTPVEFRILAFLCNRTDQHATRNELLEYVWPKNVHVVPDNVYTHIYSLRQKLKPHGVEIENCTGKGYLIRFPR